MSNLRKRENTTSRPQGAGDAAERVPVPSSRKFTPTPIRDPTLHLKLKKALTEVQCRQKLPLKKARSVAEITPTKTKQSKRFKQLGGDHEGGALKELAATATSATLHATPRPLDDGDGCSRPAAASRRRDQQARVSAASRLIYQRMVLNAWRRSRARLASLSESSRRQQEQISQLELQVDVLKNLRQSECEKRHQVTTEYQRAKDQLELAQNEMQMLYEEKIQLEEQLNKMEENITRLEVDLANSRNENENKKVRFEKLLHEVRKREIKMNEVQDENLSLRIKFNNAENTIRMHESTIESLEQHLKTNEEERTKSLQLKTELDELSRKFQEELAKNNSISAELDRQSNLKQEFERRIQELELTVSNLNEQINRALEENRKCQVDLEEQRDKWWKKTRHFLQMSWSVLQHATHLMLPAL